MLTLSVMKESENLSLVMLREIFYDSLKISKFLLTIRECERILSVTKFIGLLRVIGIITLMIIETRAP